MEASTNRKYEIDNNNPISDSVARVFEQFPEPDHPHVPTGHTDQITANTRGLKNKHLVYFSTCEPKFYLLLGEQLHLGTRPTLLPPCISPVSAVLCVHRDDHIRDAPAAQEGSDATAASK